MEKKLIFPAQEKYSSLALMIALQLYTEICCMLLTVEVSYEYVLNVQVLWNYYPMYTG